MVHWTLIHFYCFCEESLKTRVAIFWMNNLNNLIQWTKMVSVTGAELDSEAEVLQVTCVSKFIFHVDVYHWWLNKNTQPLNFLIFLYQPVSHYPASSSLSFSYFQGHKYFLQKTDIFILFSFFFRKILTIKLLKMRIIFYWWTWSKISSPIHQWRDSYIASSFWLLYVKLPNFIWERLY